MRTSKGSKKSTEAIDDVGASVDGGMTRTELKKYYYFAAVMDMAKLFAEQEIGYDVEVDIEAVAGYVESYGSAIDYHDYNGVLDSKEAMYQRVTDDMIAGFPIWKLLKLSDWTKDMLERSFARNIRARSEEPKK